MDSINFEDVFIISESGQITINFESLELIIENDLLIKLIKVWTEKGVQSLDFLDLDTDISLWFMARDFIYYVVYDKVDKDFTKNIIHKNMAIGLLKESGDIQ